MTRDQAMTLLKMEGQLHAASDAVFRITGRTDQHLADIIADNPDHPDVKVYQTIKAAFDEAKANLKETDR